MILCPLYICLVHEIKKLIIQLSRSLYLNLLYAPQFLTMLSFSLPIHLYVSFFFNFLISAVHFLFYLVNFAYFYTGMGAPSTKKGTPRI